jgi:hypothetical protein
MGRYFLLILFLTTLGKVNIFVQEIFFDDLSLPYYEIKNGVPWDRMSLETKFCQWAGAISLFTNFLSQFYCLWVAVLIKQVLKDPIHRLNRFKHLYNVLTIVICLVLTGIISIANNFGVEVR